MTYFQAIFLAFIQGITEPFPVSSLGHAVLLPGLLHWSIDEHSSLFLPFLTLLHVGTLIALSGLFWREWSGILTSLLGYHGREERDNAIRLCLLLMIGTLPAVFFGGLFEHYFRTIFASPLLVSGFLVLNGCLLLFTEYLYRKKQQGGLPARSILHLADLGALDALIIGLFQCLALFPGLSRSGATINAGLLRGLTHWNAARFSLLLAQPIILAATVREAWRLRHTTPDPVMMTQSLLGAIIAGLTALFCSAFLLQFFRQDQYQPLTPFGIYCIMAGLLSGGILFFS